MHYEIMSRAAARQATYAKSAPLTAVISITDTGSKKNLFYPQPWLIDILELQFDDVEETGAHAITREQAKEIAVFADNNYKRVKRFIIHCEFGQSRSVGIAAAISKHFEGHDSGIFATPGYMPNRTCYRYVLEALKNRVDMKRRN